MQGTGRIWANDFDCDGTEFALAKCKHRPWGSLKLGPAGGYHACMLLGQMGTWTATCTWLCAGLMLHWYLTEACALPAFLTLALTCRLPLLRAQAWAPLATILVTSAFSASHRHVSL